MMTVMKVTGMRLPEAVVHPGLKVMEAPKVRARQRSVLHKARVPARPRGKKSSKGKESSGPKQQLPCQGNGRHRRGKKAVSFLH